MLNLKSERTLWFILSSILLLRLLGLGVYPLMDTSEARYAEMARKMVELSDWVTPMFDYGVPFWGKPPLSFWTQAASMTVFGTNEFAARFPAWFIAQGGYLGSHHLFRHGAGLGVQWCCAD